MNTAISSKWVLLSSFAVTSLSLTAWKAAGTSNTFLPGVSAYTTDTIPPKVKESRTKKTYRVGEVDQAMKDLDKAILDMDQKPDIDFSKMDRDMKMAMEDLKKIDFEKISRDVSASLKKIDWEQISKEVHQSIQDAKQSLKQIDATKLQAEMTILQQKLQKDQLADMESIKKTVNKSMAEAKVDMAKAKKELTEIKAFLNALEADGLIDQKKDYQIEIKNKKLLINGKEQPDAVNEKYKKYLDRENGTRGS